MVEVIKGQNSGCWEPAKGSAGQHNEENTENCLICGNKLDYLEVGKEFKCMECNKTELGYVHCPNDHYVCDTCHGEKSFKNVIRLIHKSKGTDPISIAEDIINNSSLPMLGCEHAWVAAGSLLVAIKNQGDIKITNAQIIEALNRTRKQAIGAYCGLTGVCGVAPAIGAAFSVILGAACPKGKETAATMHVVSKVIEAIANETGPCCCKNFVYTALSTSCTLAKEYLNIELPCESQIVCKDSERHPHGCRKERCKYYPNQPEPVIIETPRDPFEYLIEKSIELGAEDVKK